MLRQQALTRYTHSAPSARAYNDNLAARPRMRGRYRDTGGMRRGSPIRKCSYLPCWLSAGWWQEESRQLSGPMLCALGRKLVDEQVRYAAAGYARRSQGKTGGDPPDVEEMGLQG